MAMEQFEKWLEENVHSNWTWQEDAKEAWIAVLKMIQGVGESANGPEHNCYYEIMDAIDKELGDGN